MRSQLANPIQNGGLLTPGPPKSTIPKIISFLDTECHAFDDQEYKFICVGDVVSEAFYMNDRLRPLVKYFIIDGTTERGTFTSSFDFHFLDGFEYIEMYNRPGTISVQIMHFITQHSQNDQQYILEIEGEEDLLVIPSVLCQMSSSPHFVFYGQPHNTDAGLDLPAGLVSILVYDEIRKRIGSLFNQFERKVFS